MPQRPSAAVMGSDLNAARDPDVVADCHQVRLGAEVKSVKNLTPPPIVSPRLFRRSSFIPEGMRRQMMLSSIDINTSRSAQFRFACASSESTPVNAFPNGPLDGFRNERAGELLGFPQPQRLHDPVTGQRPPHSGTGGAVES